MKRVLPIYIFVFFALAACLLFTLSASAATPTTLDLAVTGEAGEAVTYGESFTLTATLSGGENYTGTVSFCVVGEEEEVSVEVVGGVATRTVTMRLDAGKHTVLATYSGDDANASAMMTYKLQILPRVITILPEEVQIKDKEFDGTTAAEGEFVGVLDEVLDGDDVSVKVISALFSSSALSPSATATAALLLQGADSGNYELLTETLGGLVAEIGDITPPTADILAGGVSLVGAGGSAAHFFRDAAVLKFVFSDNASGVDPAALFYRICPIGGTPGEVYIPLPADGSLTLTELGGFELHVTASDIYGNRTDVASVGCVVFADATATVAGGTYTFYSGAPVPVRVALNGNTVLGVHVEGQATPDYTVTAEGVVLAVDYLEGLPAGTYTVTLSYLAGGYPYVAGDAPADTQFTLTVAKKTPDVGDFDIVLPTAPVYNGSPFGAAVTARPGMGLLTVVYFDAAGTRLPGYPTDAGSYTVKVEAEAGEKLEAVAGLVLGAFTIAKAPVGAPAGLVSTPCTTLANREGTVVGDLAGIEYRPAGVGAFLPITEETLTGLAPGAYELRFAERANFLAGAVTVLTVARYDGYREATPAAVFDAAAAVVTGLREGELYRIDGGEWQVPPEALGALIDRAMLLEFYHPGDGVYTLDSEVLTITVTKASAPAAGASPETLFEKCDGALTGVDATMEYRAEGETAFRAISGSAVEGLAPGNYVLRVRAVGTALASEEVLLTVAAAPEFVELTLTAEAKEGAPAVSLFGNMTADASLVALPLETAPGKGDGEARGILSLIDLRTTEVLAHIEVHFSGRVPAPALLTVTPVVALSEGSTVTVYICEGDAVRSEQCVVHEGAISVTLSGMAQVLVTAPMTTPHGRGDISWIILLCSFVAIAVAVFVFVEIKIRRARKQEAAAAAHTGEKPVRAPTKKPPETKAGEAKSAPRKAKKRKK